MYKVNALNKIRSNATNIYIYMTAYFLNNIFASIIKWTFWYQMC